MEVSAGKDLWVPLALSPIRCRIVANTCPDHPLFCLARLKPPPESLISLGNLFQCCTIILWRSFSQRPLRTSQPLLVAVPHSHVPPEASRSSPHKSAHSSLWWWSMPPLPLQQPPETHFSLGFPEVCGLNTAASCDYLCTESYRKWKAPNGCSPQSGGSSMPLMSPELGDWNNLQPWKLYFWCFPPPPPPFPSWTLNLPMILSAWLHHSWQVRSAWMEGSTNSTSHSTSSRERLQPAEVMDPVSSNKDLHQWRGRNWTRIVHVGTEVTPSPASEANPSPVGRLRRRFPLHIALSQGSPARLHCRLHKGRNSTCFLSLVTVAQHRCRRCMERGREDFPSQDSAASLWGPWIWGHCGQCQGVTTLNMEDLNSSPLLDALEQYQPVYP